MNSAMFLVLDSSLLIVQPIEQIVPLLPSLSLTNMVCEPRGFGLLFWIVDLSKRGTGSTMKKNTALGVTPPSLLRLGTADSSMPPLSSQIYLQSSFFNDNAAYGMPKA